MWEIIIRGRDWYACSTLEHILERNNIEYTIRYVNMTNNGYKFDAQYKNLVVNELAKKGIMTTDIAA